MSTRRWVSVIAAALLPMVVWPALALAAAAPTKLVMEKPVELPAHGDHPERAMVLGATLTTADGKPVGGQPVEILMATDFLGQKWATLGRVQTDSSGTASTIFVVHHSGSYAFSARYAGSDAYSAVEAPPMQAEFEALAPEVEHASRLSVIGRWVPWLGLALGVGVWLVLIYVMAEVLITIPRAGRGA
ncbi:MAG: hypothetical protein AB7G21_11965 [Dehalococcoidia bacterium]